MKNHLCTTLCLNELGDLYHSGTIILEHHDNGLQDSAATNR